MSADLVLRIIIDPTLQRLRRIDQVVSRAQMAELRPLGQRYIDVLKAETPEGKGEQPGRLRAGYRLVERYGPTSATLQITNAVPHLRWAWKGRGPVVAKRGKVLRFVINGQVFFRRRVGPSKPNAFPERAKAQMRPQIVAAAQALAQTIVRAYQGGTP